MKSKDIVCYMGSLGRVARMGDIKTVYNFAHHIFCSATQSKVDLNIYLAIDDTTSEMPRVKEMVALVNTSEFKVINITELHKLENLKLFVALISTTYNFSYKLIDIYHKIKQAEEKSSNTEKVYFWVISEYNGAISLSKSEYVRNGLSVMATDDYCLHFNLGFQTGEKNPAFCGVFFNSEVQRLAQLDRTASNTMLEKFLLKIPEYFNVLKTTAPAEPTYYFAYCQREELLGAFIASVQRCKPNDRLVFFAPGKHFSQTKKLIKYWHNVIIVTGSFTDEEFNLALAISEPLCVTTGDTTIASAISKIKSVWIYERMTWKTALSNCLEARAIRKGLPTCHIGEIDIALRRFQRLISDFCQRVLCDNTGKIQAGFQQLNEEIMADSDVVPNISRSFETLNSSELIAFQEQCDQAKNPTNDSNGFNFGFFDNNTNSNVISRSNDEALSQATKDLNLH